MRPSHPCAAASHPGHDEALGLGGCIPGLPGGGRSHARSGSRRNTPSPTTCPSVTWALAVAEPSAERTLDTNRIAVVTGGINVDYVALAFWIDRAPSMLQTLMVQSFRNSGQIAQVGMTRDRLRPEFLLTSDLRAFQLNRGAEPDLVRVRLDVQLLRMPQRDPVGSESLVADWTPTGSGIDAVVSAFDEATGKILKQLVAWTLRAGQRAMR